MPVEECAEEKAMPVDRCRLLGDTIQVEIRNIVHPGIRRLFLRDNPRGVPAGAVDKLRKMLAFLQDMEDIDELYAIPIWKVHQLAGNRKGCWSFQVTRNWRLTFRVDGEEIVDIDYEDYH